MDTGRECPTCLPLSTCMKHVKIHQWPAVNNRLNCFEQHVHVFLAGFSVGIRLSDYEHHACSTNAVMYNKLLHKYPCFILAYCNVAFLYILTYVSVNSQMLVRTLWQRSFKLALQIARVLALMP